MREAKVLGNEKKIPLPSGCLMFGLPQKYFWFAKPSLHDVVCVWFSIHSLSNVVCERNDSVSSLSNDIGMCFG